MSPTLIIQLCLLLSTSFAASVSGRFQTGRNLTSTDVQHTQITLEKVLPEPLSYKKSVFFQADGSFSINGLVDGSYLVSFTSIEYNLAPYKVRLDVVDDEVKAYAIAPGQLWADTTAHTLSLPLVVFPNLKKPTRQYIMKRNPGLLSSGPLATVINNPLYLAGAVICITLLLAPKILEFLDPEGVSNMRANSRDEFRAEKEAKGASEVTKKLERVVEKSSEKTEAKKAVAKKRKN